MKTPGILASLFSVLIFPILYGFTPYENFLLSGEPRRVGLIALADDEVMDELQPDGLRIGPDSLSNLKAAGVENLNVFIRQIEGQGFLFAFFEWKNSCTENLTTILSENCPEIAGIESKLTAHPRADEEQVWHKMEWMTCIATTRAFPHKSATVRKMGLMSGLKPDKELDYRFLHQTNWPGIVDGMIASNYRNWTTFLVDLGDKLYLFTYFEYIGEDIDADNKVMASDAVTNRWWQFTEPCLINLAGEGNWSAMTSLLN